MSEHVKAFNLLESSQVFQERLMDIDSLNGLIHLACSVLDCSLYICDGQGYILAHSPVEERACHAFRNTVENTRQISKEKLKTMLGPAPLCNVTRDPMCIGETCTRLSFPLKIGEQGLPGAITFFIWDRPLTQEGQALASMVAGAFSVFMRKRFYITGAAHASRIKLLRELLDYKPGLRSYFERGLAMENLHTLKGGFRLVFISARDDVQMDTDTLAMEIQHQIPGIWVFPHQGSILAVFSESQIAADKVVLGLEALLAAQQLAACISMEFSSLLELRYVYEGTKVCLSLAMRKAPEVSFHRAERYLDLAFLSKCREYFPLEQYYLEGFTRLDHYDKENGKGYLNTLTAYLNNNMSVSAAAKEIFMHRNTMTQQLEKIEEILGVPLKDKSTCWYLQLCLKIHELLSL